MEDEAARFLQEVEKLALGYFKLSLLLLLNTGIVDPAAQDSPNDPDQTAKADGDSRAGDPSSAATDEAASTSDIEGAAKNAEAPTEPDDAPHEELAKKEPDHEAEHAAEIDEK